MSILWLLYAEEYAQNLFCLNGTAELLQIYLPQSKPSSVRVRKEV